jgi:hypothetical protein
MDDTDQRPYVRFLASIQQDPRYKIYIYGRLNDDTSIEEKFATHTLFGVSDNQSGVIHPPRVPGVREVISQKEFNTSFLNATHDDCDEEDFTMTLEELKQKYSEEDEEVAE